jgi:pimeloyl-ACP methyl ester carboxylesterase
MDAPEVQYAKSGDVHIAYGVVGDGPFDLVFISGSVLSSLEYAWEGPPRPFFELLARFSRLILFDKRGTGLSDRGSELFDLETRMDDVRAVMDAARSQRAAIMGVSEGGPMTLLFAATYPERTAAAIIFGSTASYVGMSNLSREEKLRRIEAREQQWLDGTYFDSWFDQVAPSLGADDAARRWFARFVRLCASPRANTNLTRMNMDIDVSHALPLIRVPTLVLHRRDERVFPIDEGRAIAEAVPGAELVELPGQDHAYFIDPEQPAAEVERFLTDLWRSGEWAAPVESDRALATVLFTDIVGSTAKLAELGDAQWRAVLQEHHRRVRRQLARFGGREIDTAGDGFFATFDGPARAIRCARAIGEAVRELGLEVRAGLHTGEVELENGRVRGIAVHLGARVAAEAGAGEVLVSSTVKDLVAGSGLEFEERGAAALKGVPGEWRLYAVRP